MKAYNLNKVHSLLQLQSFSNCKTQTISLLLVSQGKVLLTLTKQHTKGNACHVNINIIIKNNLL